MDVNLSAEANLNVLLEKNGNCYKKAITSLSNKIKFYERTSKGKEKLRTRSGKSFPHKLLICKKMLKMAHELKP